jgi:dipeptidyl aminopeptidase/acylaminoacyl peptidase
MQQLATSEYPQFPGSFSRDGKQVVFVEWHEDAGGDIAVVDVDSGKVAPFANNPKFSEAQPGFSPDGRWIAYTSDESGDRKVLVKGDVRRADYLRTGHIVYVPAGNDTNNLFAVPFDPDKLKLTGGSVSILEGVGGAAFSDSGTLVCVSQPASAAGAAGTALSGRTPVWVDRQGKEEPIGASPDAYEDLRISPGGSKVALTIAGANKGYASKVLQKEGGSC